MQIRNLRFWYNEGGYSLMETLVALTIISTAMVLFLYLITNLMNASSNKEVGLYKASQEIYQNLYDDPSLLPLDTIQIKGKKIYYKYTIENSSDNYYSGKLLVKDVNSDLSIQLYCVLPGKNNEE